MIATTLILGTGPTVLIAVLMLMMPSLTQPTLPLGVSVPASRVGEPVIGQAVRKFRLWVAGALVLALASVFALAWVAPVAASTVPVPLVLVLSGAAYVVARGGIRRAKEQEGWYESVPVRLTASVTGGHRAPVPFVWYIVALVILMAAGVVGVALYPSLPDSIATHFNGSGVADTYSPKSFFSVFGVLLVGFGLVVLLFALALWVRVVQPRQRADADPARSARRAHAQLRLMQGLLGQITATSSLLIAVSSLVVWLGPGEAALVNVGIFVPLALLLVVIVVFAVRYQRAMRVAPAAAPQPAPHGEPVSRAGAATSGLVASASRDARTSDVDPTPSDAPDDDRFWKLGLFYVNRNDPAFLVPKRFGIGWTINLGSVGGMALGIVLALVIVGAIVAGFVLPSQHGFGVH
ncbi:DUF1648 domain-containing protein [Microbacterium sp. STN6]|uniref:DUF1648 domain-containing protein n=1 Tax=Microbacterium sp. STN6 TaxID=2995588 RepID=UPI002260C1A9|nr:DUF1648 domain-containing protein [Microbacterium sp. STN6]MCX7521830.1 DUF1648 domain-containing protein [Microbacterium sp. STN6]